MAAQKGYLGNANLKEVGEIIEFTKEQREEYHKCSKSVEYFLENYAQIVSLDDGVVKFKPFPYQKRSLKAIQKSRKVVLMYSRQLGKSTIVAGYVAWLCLFSPDPQRACIMANKMAIAKEIFSRVQMIIEYCPRWLQQGVKEWNKTSFELETGTTCFCAATSPSAVRGKSISCLILDEFAHLGSNLAEEFIASVFPTISSSEKSKLIIVSTPKGMNHFYKLWMESDAPGSSNTNGFKAVFGHWKEHPKRSQKWADEQLAILGPVKYAQEVESSFVGSSNTLIDGPKIAALALKQPLSSSLDGFVAYYTPHEKKSYVTLVDTSRGANLDYSAFVIIEVSSMPYKIVAKFKNNKINTLIYPEVIAKYSKIYNDAFVLIETNDLGQQVADILLYDLEYENVYMSKSDNLYEGGGMSTSPGLRTTKRTKNLGCNAIKIIIENDQMEVNDAEIIEEMSVFTRSGSSYKAEEGKHDDLMMCLVMFGYLSTTPIFQDLFDFSLRKKLIASQISDMEDNSLPIGFFNDGREYDENELIANF